MKKIISLIFMVTVAIYIAGLLGYILPYIILFAVFSLMIYGLIFSLVTDILWRLMPSDIKNNKNRIRFKVIIFICFLFFLTNGFIINKYLLTDFLHLTSILGNLVIVSCAVFMVWVLLKDIKKSVVLAGLGTYAVCIVVLAIFGSVTINKTEIRSMQMVKTLPYLDWFPVDQSEGRSGVIQSDEKKYYKGINIYATRNLPEAYLMDMAGNVLHTWTAKVHPDDTWQHIEVCSNGDLLTIVKDRCLLRLDWESNIKWTKNIRVHHDIAVDENKDIWFIKRKDELVFYSFFPVPILNDYLVVLSQNGVKKKEISLYNVLRKNISLGKILNIYLKMPLNLVEIIIKKIKYKYFFDEGSPYDVFHNNTLEIINRDIPELCDKGDLMFSLRNLDFIGIISQQNKRVIWKWGDGEISAQHHPTLLENGNILVFDNGVSRRYSRVIEINPFTNDIVWEFKENPPDSFFTFTRGANQRLPNGNTLITESNKGRVFEVTREGEIVWEFFNPEVKNNTKERGAIYRMMRITSEELQCIVNNH